MNEHRFHGRAFVDGAVTKDVLVTLRGSTIAEVMPSAAAPADATPVRGLMAPGFVDVHVHGGEGADFTDGHDQGDERILLFHARHGTTALAATTLSAGRHALRRAVESIVRSSGSRAGAAEVCGIHLEGPYLNPRNAGAQDAASIRPPNLDEVAALLSQAPGLRWMMTLAPEIGGARGLIERFRDRIRFSVGHTSATFTEAEAALGWGASHFTHLFNAMPGLHHREPGVVGAALASADATAELIADGIHVHPAVLRIAATVLPRRIALITDAMRGAGMPDGSYKLYDYDVTVRNGSAQLADGTLAGSLLTMGEAVRNMVERAGLPIESVIPMATEVPARILGVADRKGRLAPGYDADLVILGESLEVERVFARGVEVSDAAGGSRGTPR